MKYVKEIKPHEERFFKDIVLKSILEEIANEQEKPLPDLIPSNSSKRAKRQTVFLSFLSVLILSAFLIPLTMQVTEPVQKSVLPAQYTLLPTAKQEAAQTPTTTINTSKQQPSKILIESKDESLIIVSDNAVETSTELIQQNEHERAKAQLLEQMKN